MIKLLEHKISVEHKSLKTHEHSFHTIAKYLGLDLQNGLLCSVWRQKQTYLMLCTSTNKACLKKQQKSFWHTHATEKIYLFKLIHQNATHS